MVDNIRKMIRPFISVSLILMLGYLTVEKLIPAKDILYLTGIVVAFHFGERAALKQPEKTEVTDEAKSST